MNVNSIFLVCSYVICTFAIETPYVSSSGYQLHQLNPDFVNIFDANSMEESNKLTKVGGILAKHVDEGRSYLLPYPDTAESEEIQPRSGDEDESNGDISDFLYNDRNDDKDSNGMNKNIVAVGSSLKSMAALVPANPQLLEAAGVNPNHIIGYIPVSSPDGHTLVFPSGAVSILSPDESDKLKTKRILGQDLHYNDDDDDDNDDIDIDSALLGRGVDLRRKNSPQRYYSTRYQNGNFAHRPEYNFERIRNTKRTKITKRYRRPTVLKEDFYYSNENKKRGTHTQIKKKKTKVGQQQKKKKTNSHKRPSRRPTYHPRNNPPRPKWFLN